MRLVKVLVSVFFSLILKYGSNMVLPKINFELLSDS